MLIKERLVGGAAALGDEHEFVSVALVGIELNLGRQVIAGVFLVVHVQRRELAVAQIVGGVGAANAFRDGGLVVAVHPDVLALLAHDDGGAGVLTHGQYAPGGDVGVLEEVHRHEPVIVGSVRVIKDARQLLQVRRPQQMRRVGKAFRRQLGDPFRIDFEDFPSAGVDGLDIIAGDMAVFGGVLHRGDKRVEV